MPIGSFAILPFIAAEAQRMRPASILDAGIGYGLYGPVFRQWLDMGVKPHQVQLDGIEVFESYRSPCWQEYDNVYLMDIKDFVTDKRYDMIIFTDVIEHFELAEGLAIVDKLKSMLAPGGVLFVGTPAVWLAQNAVHGNEHERHLSFYTLADFPGFEVVLDGSDFIGNHMLLVKYTNPNNYE